MSAWKWALLLLGIFAVFMFTKSYQVPPAYVVFSNTPSEQYTFDTFPTNFVKYEIPDDAGGQAGVELVDGKLKMWLRTGHDACLRTESQVGVAWDFHVGKLYKIVTASAYLPQYDWRWYYVLLSPYDKQDLAAYDAGRDSNIMWGHVIVLKFGKNPSTGECYSGYCTPPTEIYLYVSPQGGVYAWDGAGNPIEVHASQVNPDAIRSIALVVANSDCRGGDYYMDWVVDEIDVYDMDFGVFGQVNVRNLAEAGVPARILLDGIDARNAGSYDVNVYINGSLYTSTTISGFPAEVPVEFSSSGDYEVNVVAVRKTDGMLSYHTLPVRVVSGRSVGYNKSFVVELNVPRDLNDYTVLLRLDTNEWIQNGWVDSDLNGVRFYDKFGTLLPAWVIPETRGTSDTWIYVKVPHLSAPTDSIYVYLGGYPPYWDGYRALDAFDDFSDFIIEDYYVQTNFGASYTISDGVLHVSAGGSNDAVELSGKYVVLDQVELVARLKSYSDYESYAETVSLTGIPFRHRLVSALANFKASSTDVRVSWISLYEYNSLPYPNTVWRTYVYRPFETNEIAHLYALDPDVFDIELNVYDSYLSHPDVFGFDWDPDVHLLWGRLLSRYSSDLDYFGYRRYIWDADPAVLSLSEPTFPTETTISVSNPTVDVNEIFQATVCVTSQGTPLPSAPVQLLVSTDGESYQVYDEDVTGSDGCYVFDVSLSYPGDYYLEGRTATFGYYQGSESDYVLVHVVTQEPDENAELCTSLGYYWAGDHCCGDDAGEYTPDTCDGIFNPAGCTCSSRPPAGGGGGVSLTPPPVAPPGVVEQPEVTVQPASPLEAVPTWAWLLAVVVVLYILYSFSRKR